MNKEAAEQFLGALYAGKPDEHYIQLWRLENKSSHFFRDVEQAAIYAATVSRDIYVGCGLSPADLGADKRCPADRIAGIPGFWIDLDVHHSDPRVHKKDNLPPDADSALKILQKLPFKPTVILDSGYGLQAWWLFREVWTFDSDEERSEAAALSLRWHQLFTHTSQSFGYEGDSLGDLSRIFRVAGTLNCKIPDEPKPVRVRWGKNDRRFNPEDFREVIGDIERAGGFEQRKPVNPGAWDGKKDWSKGADVGLLIAADRQPPIEKFQELRHRSRKFGITFDHKRTDMKDTSSSSYDQSLALFAARAKWTDQEICDLLIWHQSKYPPRLGPRRPMYFRAAIEKARSLCQPDPAIERMRQATGGSSIDPAGTRADRRVTRDPEPASLPREVTDSPSPPELTRVATAGADEPPPPEGLPFDGLKELSDLFGVTLKRIIKQLSQPPLYTIETDAGNLFLGTVNNLIEQRALRNHLATAGVYLDKRKEDEWGPIARVMLQCVTAVEVTADATTAGTVAAWVRDYLRDTTICDSIEEADPQGNPFVKDDKLMVYSPALRKYLITNNGERNLTSHELASMLREYGAVPRTFSLTVNKRKTTRWCWIMPGDAGDFRESE